MLAGLPLAGCGDGGQPPVTNNQAAAAETPEEAEPQNITANLTLPEPKSIIRPTIVDQEIKQEPVLEPIERTISFATSGLKLDEAAHQELDKLVGERVVAEGGKITLRGHSDSRGADGDNLVASRLRAEAVRDYLESKGVPVERITVIPLGETRPIAPNANLDGSDDPEGRAKNRRVEIKVDVPAPAPSEPLPGR